MGRLGSTTGLIAVTLLSLMTAAGCTGKSEQSSSVKIVLPSTVPHPKASQAQSKLQASSVVTAPTNLKVFHIVINIHGQGINQPPWVWDADCDPMESDTSTCKPLPNEVSFEVPQGTGRLFQALVVSADTTTGQMFFHYGDKLTDLTASTASVGITISPIGSGSGLEGRVAGRYFSASGAGSTGEVAVQYQPAGSKPAMTIMKSAIFGGWFNFFAIDGAPFTYRIIGQAAPLFSAVSTTSFSASTQHYMRVSIPAYTSDNGGGRDKREIVFGGFASDPTYFPAGFAACYDATPVTYAGIYEDGSGSSTLEWLGAAGTADLDGISTDNIYVMNGGASSTAACSATEYSQMLKFRPERLKEDDDATLGFHGPFKIIPAGSRYAPVKWSLASDGQQVKLEWQLLPGVNGRTDSIHGVELFVRTTAGGLGNGNDDDLNCSELPTKYGYASRGTRSSTDPDQSLAFDLGTGNLSDASAVLCPYRDAAGRQYLSAGAAIVSRFSSWDAPGVLDLTLTRNSSGVNMSDLGRLGFFGSATYKVPRGALTYNSSNMMVLLPVVRKGKELQYLDQNDLEKVEFSTDNGATFTQVYLAGSDALSGFDANYSSMESSFLASSVAPSAATTGYRIRYTVKSAAASNYNLDAASLVYTTGTMNVIESDATAGACSTASIVLQHKTSSGFTTISTWAQAMGAMFISPADGPGEGSDAQATVRFRFDPSDVDCDGTDVFASGFEVQAVSDNCFGVDEIRPGTRLGEFVISPRDRYGRDCDLTGARLQAHVFNQDGGAMVYFGDSGAIGAQPFDSSHVIRHSTYATGAGVFLSHQDVFGTQKLQLRNLILGASAKTGLLAGSTNSDGQPTGQKIALDWSSGASAFWSSLVSSLTSTSFFSLTTVASPLANPPAELHAVKAGGVEKASFTSTVAAIDDVIAVSQEPLGGGSQILLTRKLVSGIYQYKVLFQPTNGNNSPLGESLIDLAGGLSLPTTATAAPRPYAAVLRHENGRAYYAFSVDRSVYIGVVDFNNDRSVSVHGPLTTSEEILGLAGVSEWVAGGQQSSLVLATVNSGRTQASVYRIDVPEHGTTEWSSMSIPGSPTTTFSDAAFTHHFGLTKCAGNDQEVFISGTTSVTAPDQFNVYALRRTSSYLSSTMYQLVLTTDGSVASELDVYDQDMVACAHDAPAQVLTFVLADKDQPASTTPPKLVVFGPAYTTGEATISASEFGTATVGSLSMIQSHGGRGAVFTYADGSGSRQVIKFIPTPHVGDATPALGTGEIWGTLPLTTPITGVGSYMSYDSDSPFISIFGTQGQYYQLRR